MRTPEMLIVPDERELARAGAEVFVRCARDAVHERGRFSVMLSGGSTPKKLFQRLASSEMIDQVPWKHTHVFWGDERLVPPNHPESNFLMASEALLRFVPIPGDQIHRVRTELARTEGTDAAAPVADDYERLLRDFGSRIDLILLGMGEDGHTASLFPDISIPGSGRLVIAPWVSKLQAYRVSISPEVLSSARQIVFLISGEKKAPTLKKVIEDPVDPIRYPIQRVKPRDGKVLWIVDEQAASLLSADLLASGKKRLSA